MEKYEVIDRFSVNLKIELTCEDVDDIMETALEGGVTALWCRRVDVEPEFLGDCASEQISRGGYLRFVLLEEFDDGYDEYVMMLKNFAHGVRKFLEDPFNHSYLKRDCEDAAYRIDTAEVDATVADAIVQYALFGEIVFG